MRPLPASLCLALALACTPDPRNPVIVSGSEDLGILAFPPAIRGRDGGYGAAWQGRSVWVFGDTPLEVEATDGSRWRTSTFTTTLDTDASDGLVPFVEPLDANGAPGQLLPFTAEEAAWNASQEAPACTEDCAPRWVLWPWQLVPAPDGDGALLFYDKLRDWESAGIGIATWAHPDAAVERPILRPEAAEPRSMFDPDEPPFGMAMLEGETLYVWGCEHVGWFEFDCPLARVAYDQALERDAWEFWNGDTWTPNIEEVRSVMDGAPIMTVHHNSFLDRYMAVYASESGEIVCRVAERPEGPWSAEETLHVPLAPVDDSFVYDGVVHPELASDEGRTIYLTYSRVTGFLASEMRLVRVDFAGLE